MPLERDVGKPTGTYTKNIQRFKRLWREHINLRSGYLDQFEAVANAISTLDSANPSEERLKNLLYDIWLWFSKVYVPSKEEEWAKAVCDGGLFNLYKTAFAPGKPTPLMGQIGLFSTEGVLRKRYPFYAPSHFPSPINLVHCAHRNWDRFSDDERQRTIEVVSGAVATKMRSRAYRRLDDLALEVNLALFQFPRPQYMGMRLACRNMAAFKRTYSFRCYFAAHAEVWWQDFANYCIKQIDKNFRPRAAKFEFVDLPSEQLQNNSCESWIDLTQFPDLDRTIDPIESFVAKESARTIESYFGEKTQQVLQLRGHEYTYEEIARIRNVSAETVKELLAQARRRAKKMPALQQSLANAERALSRKQRKKSQHK